MKFEADPVTEFLLPETLVCEAYRSRGDPPGLVAVSIGSA